ncbi:hypothetical protein PR048_008538 [Dryococelus australis]|uniref:Peptidase S1 domain-containing protein n=1 Tax=Dryococelus australis TaxID=614101 RepID=A0ABQ9HY77_9NEOP|nr:hypothetical protein PR048_008538 [Dryococelus australis]
MQLKICVVRSTSNCLDYRSLSDALRSDMCESSWENFRVVNTLVRFDERNMQFFCAETRIVGGEVATQNSFPFMAFVDVTTSPSGTARCGGSVIGSEWILIAAHCLGYTVYPADVTVYPADVTVGAYDISDDEDSAVIITSFDLVQHPGWNATTRQNFIGLIKLVKKIEFKDTRSNFLLNRSSRKHTMAAKLQSSAGEEPETVSDEFLSEEERYVIVPVTSNSNCSAQFGGVNGTDSEICTSGLGGKNPCNEDSDGPLIVEDSDGNVAQIGVVSF